MSKISYTSKDIQVLGDIDNVRTNPEMYIDETNNPVHLIEECLDNALDECLAGFATIVAVTLDTKKNEYSVLDNGRGIPIDDKNTIVTITSKLFSGGKFKGSKTAYNICSGLHGVGLVAVNALSEYMSIEVYRDNKTALFQFKNAVLKQSDITEHKGPIPFSTKILFKPDKKQFETLIPDVDRIRKRLLVASVELRNCKFVLLYDDKKEVFSLDSNEFFQKYCLSEGEESGKIISLNSYDQKTTECLKILFSYSLNGSTAQKVISSVNLLPVDGGGTHVSMFFDLIKDVINGKAKKLSYKFQPSDALCFLRSYISLSLVESKFSGQAKGKLANRKSDLDKLYSSVKSSIEDYFDKNQDDLFQILEHLQTYRRRLDSKKLKSNSVERSSTKFTKLRDCTSRDGILYIVEGDSAAGSFIDGRDPRFHAIFPLKGKIKSVARKDILENNEIRELIQAIGTGVGDHFDISHLRYSKICAAVDADEDGAHIFCLLTMALATLVPDIIKENMYFLAQTPLYAVNDKKRFIPLWDLSELEIARKNGEKITRFKGLGELSPWQLKICAIDELTRKFVPVSFTKDLSKLMKLFIDVNSKRDLLENKFEI